MFLAVVAFLFIGACMLVFCLSRSKTKRFFEQPNKENFSSVNAFHITSIVFMVLISIFTFSYLSTFFISLIEIWTEEDPYETIMDMVSIAEFAFAAVTFALGIYALTESGKAKTLYNRLYPTPRVYYSSPQQGYGYQQYPRQGYQQPVNPQQGYGYQQQYPPQSHQQPAPQQVNPQTAAPQQGNPQPAYSQQSSPQPTFSQQYTQPSDQQNTCTEPTVPKEKMCPNCGVVNEGKNKFCVICGKPL